MCLFNTGKKQLKICQVHVFLLYQRMPVTDELSVPHVFLSVKSILKKN